MSISDVLPTVEGRPWNRSGVVALAALGIIAWVYQDTFASLVGVWLRSETFAHCFLIAPISAYLVWRRRGELREARKAPSALGVLAVAILAGGWFVATLVSVQFGEHLALVLLVPATVVAIVGTDVAKRIAMPLAFLVFAVPFGEALIPSLMDFTATFTVHALQLTGIPVLREGYYFSIPSGDFEVAVACSGIRYLIACVALGVLYAHVAYSTWSKRLIFVAASIVAPIVANGIRAYMIVLIAHLSDMKLAVGIDHLVYGWLFFGLLVACMFWVGSRFEDPPIAAPPIPLPRTWRPEPRLMVFIAVATLVVTIAATAPVLVSTRGAVDNVSMQVPALPYASGGWTGPRAPTDPWFAERGGLGGSAGLYVGSSGAVEVAVFPCCVGGADTERIGFVPTLIDSGRWQTLQRETLEISLGDSKFRVVETALKSRAGYRVLWHWYAVNGKDVASDWRAKVLEAWTVLRHGRSDVALVVLSAGSSSLDAARGVLSQFAHDNGTALRGCLHGLVCPKTP
jgi:exosortase A